jgi:hypothetical protein
MTGGLIQLVAYGVQDIYLTKDPQITYFKIVYRRHTNFSTEVIPQYFIQTPDFGKRISCVLSRSGDLIGKMHLVAVLPSIPQFRDENNNIDVISKFAWVRRIGYALIKTIEVEIGNELIDRQYGDWLNIWHELTISHNKNLDKLLGEVKELIDFSNGKKSYKLYIPLRFWFNRFPGLALPIVSLQHNHITINLELNDLSKCFIVVPTHYINIDNDFVNFKPFEFIEQNVDGVVSLARYIYFDINNRQLYLWRLTDNGFLSLTETDPQKIATEEQQDALLYARDSNNNYVNAKYFINGITTKFFAMPRINAIERLSLNRSVRTSTIILKDAFLLVEYVFLDDEERVRFSQAKHEYLIQQLVYNGEKTLDGINQSFNINFTKPCIELHWVTQLSIFQNTNINDHFNYTDSLLKLYNPDDKTHLYELPIGKNIIQQESILFNGQERVSHRSSEYFTDVQVYQHHKHSHTRMINVYSMALHPENHQPSGAANMSKIDYILLKLSTNPNINFKNTAKLRMYGLTYNILRIVHGISGLVFANDESSLINIL